MSPYFAVEHFKHRLGQDDRWSYEEAVSIIADLINDINDSLLDIMADSLEEALNIADSMGVSELANDIHLVEMADGVFRIGTYSGKTDYSTDAKHMLPHLLRNAKVSKKGEMYKVIPIRDKKPSGELSSFSTMQKKQDAIGNARKALRGKRAGASIGDSVRSMRDMLGHTAAATQEKQKYIEVGDPDFKTASSKQNPDTQWVIPAKSLDMTPYLSDINNNIIVATHSTVTSIIEMYTSQYL